MVPLRTRTRCQISHKASGVCGYRGRRGRHDSECGVGEEWSMGRELQQTERLTGKQRALVYIVVCTSTWMSMRWSSGPLMRFW